jgi:nitrite reductase/ring-hydroxylating ferredoxin subunit
VPVGWFVVALSSELPPRGVLPLRYFGKHLVLFRAESGEPYVLSAFCPHLGAHLGHGGVVSGESIRCPFHGWCFDGRGACTDVPLATRRRSAPRIPSVPVREHSGMILVYFHPTAEAPAWEVPELPEHTSSEWTPFEVRRWKIRTHVQEMAENGFDMTHFHFLHGLHNLPKAELTFEGPHCRLRTRTVMHTPLGLVDGELRFHSLGFGFGVVRFSGLIDTLLVTAVTPIDDEYVDARFLFKVKRLEDEGAASIVGLGFIEELARQVDQDIPIWENKVYKERPVYGEHDGTLAAFRRWARQFYPLALSSPASSGSALRPSPVPESGSQLREHIAAALQRCNGNVRAASRELGIHRAELRRLLDRLLIEVLPELERKKQDLERLTEELRYQVVAHSRELTEVLSRAGTVLDSVTVNPSDVVEGRYRVVRAIGAGGMGTVYEVERISDSYPLALKVLTCPISGAAAARFTREAEIGACVRHPNVVAIVDVGIIRGAGAPFLVMELVEGGSLDDRRERFGDVQWALTLLAQVAAGLAELHAAGVVHRDLKPSNVLLSGEGDGTVACIADFGISRFGAVDTGDSGVKTVNTTPRMAGARALTRTGALVGTPLYMPPEAVEGSRTLTAAADVFAFGLLAYELLTKEFPFVTAPVFLTLAEQPLPSPPSLAGLGVPLDLESLLVACLAEDPASRPRIDALQDALERKVQRGAV